jgi:hypothetical protein
VPMAGPRVRRVAQRAGTRLAPVGEPAQAPRPDATPRSRLSLLGRLHPESNLPRIELAPNRTCPDRTCPDRTCNEAGRARRKRRRSASTTTDHRQQHMSGRERLGAWTQW